MARYLVAIHHPDNYDPSQEDKAMDQDIDVLNGEMVAAGVRAFVGGLRPARSAKSLRRQPDGKVLVTEGPYLRKPGQRSPIFRRREIVERSVSPQVFQNGYKARGS